MGKCEIIGLTKKLFLRTVIKERRFYDEAGMKKTRNKKGKKKGQPREFRKGFLFLADLPVSRRNVEAIVMHGRMRWKIENEGFNTQKKHGYCLEYQFSRDYQAQKCHYYLIQTDHMVAQVLEAWGKLWEGVGQSREQKHRRVLESFKTCRLAEAEGELGRKVQIRLI